MSRAQISLLLQDSDPFQIISNFLDSPILRISGQLIVLLFVVLWIALVYWTYTDAGRRGATRVLWGIVAVIFPYVGTLIYLIVRPPRVPGRVARARAGDGGPRAGVEKQHYAVPELPQPGGERLPDLPHLRLGAEEAVH